MEILESGPGRVQEAQFKAEINEHHVWLALCNIVVSNMFHNGLSN